MIRNKIFTIVAIPTIASLITMFGCDREPHVSPESVLGEPEVALSKQGELREVQSAVAKYHALQQALADGYVQVTSCDESPGEGAQGFHYLNFALLDEVVEPTTPELLMYIPTKNGLKFVGVEYAVLNNGQPPPSLFGHEFHPFDGLYVLHLWVLPEVPNPNGLFGDWNPNLSCSGQQGLLFPNENHLRLVAVENAGPIELSPTPPEGFTGDFDEWERNEAFGLWTLHAWIWLANPDGVFAETNPLVP